MFITTLAGSEVFSVTDGANYFTVFSNEATQDGWTQGQMPQMPNGQTPPEMPEGMLPEGWKPSDGARPQ